VFTIRHQHVPINYFGVFDVHLLIKIINSAKCTIRTRAVRKVSGHFEYLENRPHCLDITWRPIGGDLTVHP
jgi:hypothetical protein